jgi:hypothetical protein
MQATPNPKTQKPFRVVDKVVKGDGSRKDVAKIKKRDRERQTNEKM